MAISIDDNYRRIVRNAVRRNMTGDKHIQGIFSLLANCRRTLSDNHKMEVGLVRRGIHFHISTPNIFN